MPPSSRREGLAAGWPAGRPVSSAQLGEEGARWTWARQTGQREAARTQGTAQDQWKRCAQGRCATTSPARSSSRHTAHSHGASASDDGVLHLPSRLQLNRRRRAAAPPPLAGFENENTSRCSSRGVAPGSAAVAECWRLLLLASVLVACGGFAAVRGRTVPVLI